jgi:hypothetical protein
MGDCVGIGEGVGTGVVFIGEGGTDGVVVGVEVLVGIGVVVKIGVDVAKIGVSEGGRVVAGGVVVKIGVSDGFGVGEDGFSDGERDGFEVSIGLFCQ